MTQSNILFIGMDVHKESIVISMTDDDRSEVRRYGSIGGSLSDFMDLGGTDSPFSSSGTLLIKC